MLIANQHQYINSRCLTPAHRKAGLGTRNSGLEGVELSEKIILENPTTTRDEKMLSRSQF